MTLDILNTCLIVDFHWSLNTLNTRFSFVNTPDTCLSLVQAGPHDPRELYLGSLHVSEHQKVFGYVTNTRVKLVIVVDNTNTALRDNEIRQMFRKLHTAYTNVVANPFFTPGECIFSKKFDATARAIMGFREN